MQETNNQFQRTESNQRQNDETSQRNILGARDPSTSTNEPSNIYNQGNSQSIDVTRSTTLPGPAFSKKSAPDLNDKQFMIFHDPNGEIGNLASSEVLGPWKDFGTELENKKENAKEPEPWRGVTLLQDKKFRMPMTQKFEVYHDQVFFFS